MNKQKMKVIAQKTFVFLSGIGAAAITTQLIKNNTNPQNVIQKVTIPLGAFALGGVLANAAMHQAEKDMQDLEIIVTEVSAVVKKAQQVK